MVFVGFLDFLVCEFFEFFELFEFLGFSSFPGFQKVLTRCSQKVNKRRSNGKLCCK